MLKQELHTAWNCEIETGKYVRWADKISLLAFVFFFSLPWFLVEYIERVQSNNMTERIQSRFAVNHIIYLHTL